MENQNMGSLLNVLSQMERKEVEVANRLKLANEKLNLAVTEKNALLKTINDTKSRAALLNMEICKFDSILPKLENEIEDITKNSEELLSETELLKWKQTLIKITTDMVSEKMNIEYAAMEEFVHKYEAMEKENCSDLSNNKHASSKLSNKKDILDKINDLEQEIRNVKTRISGYDKEKLQQEIQILQNRNSAIILRLRRQIQEAEARLRHKRGELNNLKKLHDEQVTYLSTQVEEEYEQK
uniref:Uncharacterized protein n=1 Tax=Clastoptera arizonana TaxID=38151 RepID=A0A1B6DAL5_9HEMI